MPEWRNCVCHWIPVVSQEAAPQRESPCLDVSGCSGKMIPGLKLICGVGHANLYARQLTLALPACEPLG